MQAVILDKTNKTYILKTRKCMAHSNKNQQFNRTQEKQLTCIKIITQKKKKTLQ